MTNDSEYYKQLAALFWHSLYRSNFYNKDYNTQVLWENAMREFISKLESEK